MAQQPINPNRENKITPPVEYDLPTNSSTTGETKATIIGRLMPPCSTAMDCINNIQPKHIVERSASKVIADPKSLFAFNQAKQTISHNSTAYALIHSLNSYPDGAQYFNFGYKPADSGPVIELNCAMMHPYLWEQCQLQTQLIQEHSQQFLDCHNNRHTWSGFES